MRRRFVHLLVAIGTAVLVVVPGLGNAAAPGLATVDVSFGARIKPVGTTTGQCAAELARPDSNGQTMTVLVKGTAQSGGAVASTGISCTIYQDPDRDLKFDTSAGGCSAALPLNVAACAELVEGVPILPFRMCAVSTAHLITGQVVTGYGLGCPRDFTP